MNLLSVKPPTIPIPLHKYLKIVAIVDATDPETKRLLDHFVVSEILGRFPLGIPQTFG